jgi:hypothetical protein
MKHLKTFENFSVLEGKFKKFFTGHSSSEEKDQAKSKFFSELEDFEKKSNNDSNISFNREFLEEKAKENNYKGGLEARTSAKDGREYIIYKKGVTGLEDLASSAHIAGDAY